MAQNVVKEKMFCFGLSFVEEFAIVLTPPEINNSESSFCLYLVICYFIIID